MNYNTWGTIILNEGNYLIVQSKDFLFKINSNNVNTSVEIFKNNNNIFSFKDNKYYSPKYKSLFVRSYNNHKYYRY